MRVALIIDGLAVGGAERQAVLTAHALRDHCESVMIVCYGPTGWLYRQAIERGVRVVSIRAKGMLRGDRIRAIAGELRGSRVDIAYAFKESACLFGRLAAQVAGTRAIFGGYRGITPATPLERIANCALNWRTDGWIVNSQAVKQHLVGLFRVAPSLVHVVPNCVEVVADAEVERDAVRASLGIDPGRRVVMIAARMSPIKNHRLLVDAVALLARRCPDVVVYLVGDGEMRNGIEQAIDAAGLRACMRLVGEREDVPRLFHAADVAVLTSVSEGLPNVVLEAAAAGVATVATDSPGVRTVVRDGVTGVIVDHEPGSVAAGLERLLSNPQERVRLGQAAREMVRSEYSAQLLGENLARLFRRHFI